MKSPVQYSHELEEALKESPISIAKLTQLEQSLQLDLHALRMQFKGRVASTLQQSSKKSGAERAEQHKRLEEEDQTRTKGLPGSVGPGQKSDRTKIITTHTTNAGVSFRHSRDQTSIGWIYFLFGTDNQPITICSPKLADGSDVLLTRNSPNWGKFKLIYWLNLSARNGIHLGSPTCIPV